MVFTSNCNEQSHQAPGVSRESAQAPDGDVIVVVTHSSLVDDPAARAGFWQVVNETQPIMAKAPGLLGHSLRRETVGNNVLTMMIWEDQDSLTTFACGEASELLSRASEQSCSNHHACCVELPRDQVPLTWNDALALFGR